MEFPEWEPITDEDLLEYYEYLGRTIVRKKVKMDKPNELLKGYILLTECYHNSSEFGVRSPGQLYALEKFREPFKTQKEGEILATQLVQNRPDATIYIARLVLAVKVNLPIVKIKLG